MRLWISRARSLTHCEMSAHEIRVDAASTRSEPGTNPELVMRVDFGVVQSSKRTPQGGLRVPARLTRTGVFIYRDASGNERREWRPPDEVFRADSLATLEDAPVTRDHPNSLVDPSNWKATSIGHVRPGVRRDGAFVEADVVVQDAAAVSAVERKELVEVSCGYRCRVEMTAGVTPEGERYDAVQRDITYNHIALGPRGWGRAGRDVALRLDADDRVLVERADSDHPAPPAPARKHMKTIRIDGVDYEVGSEAHLQAQRKLDEQRAARIDALEKELTTLRGEREQLQGRLDAATAELTELKKPERIDAAVKARTELVDVARRVLGEVKLDGVSDREVMERVIAKADPQAKFDGRSDDYVRGRFEHVVATQGTPRTDSATPLQRVLPSVVTPPTAPPATPRKDSATARAEMVAQRPWEQPLAVSKDVAKS